MLVLALDLSTHTGFAVMEGEKGSKPKLINYGVVHLGKSIFECAPFPWCYRAAAQEQALKMSDILYKYKPNVVVIEQINGGRARYVQKVLENIHTAVLDLLLNYIKTDNPKLEVVYIDSSQWRSNLGLRMSKEQTKANAKLSKAKRTAADTGSRVNKKELGINGKVTVKHLSVMHANEVFGLKLKMVNNDSADALNLGLAFYNNAILCDGI